MDILTNENYPDVIDVYFENDMLCLKIKDGRVIQAPLKWFPRLANATPEQRNHWRLIAGGYGVHWPDIDEHISAYGLMGTTVRLAKEPTRKDIFVH